VRAQIIQASAESATAANIRLIRITARFNQVALVPGSGATSQKHRPNRNMVTAARCQVRRIMPSAINEGETRYSNRNAAVARNHHSTNVRSLQNAMLMIPAATTRENVQPLQLGNGRLDASGFSTTCPTQD
jgi:hypothetical protein